MSIEFKPEFDNTTGAVHGGILAMLADTAVACALAPAFDGEMNFAPSNLNIHFLRRASAAVTATATIIKKGSRVCVGSCELHDEAGQLVATATCDFVLLRRGSLQNHPPRLGRKPKGPTGGTLGGEEPKLSG